MPIKRVCPNLEYVSLQLLSFNFLLQNSYFLLYFITITMLKISMFKSTVIYIIKQIYIIKNNYDMDNIFYSNHRYFFNYVYLFNYITKFKVEHINF